MGMRRTLVLLFGLIGLALLGMRATPIHAQEEVVLQIQPGGLSSPDPQARAVNAWIDQASPAASHVADTDLQVQATVAPPAVGSNANTRAIVQFDISRIPRSGIKAAIMHLWVDTPPPSGTESWDIDPIMSFNSWAQPSQISWTNRTNQLAWSAPGGDFNPGIPCTISPVVAGDNSCDVTLTFLSYFGGLPPIANYGYLILDEAENTAAATETGTIASNSQATIPPGCSPISPPTCVTHAPSLVVDFIQQVHSLTATPGSGQVILNWKYPTAVGNTSGTGLSGNALNPTTGVVILRSLSTPVDDTALFQDGTALPASCTGIGTAATTIVVNSVAGTGTGLPTTFTDNTCGITDTNIYYYKVIAVAALPVVPPATQTYNYSQNGNAAAFSAALADTSFAAEISATPDTGAAGQQAPVWIAPVRSAALNPPSIDPGNYAIVAANNFLVQGFNPTTGDDAIAPVSVGGIAAAAASARVPVLEAGEADFGPIVENAAIPMTYVAADDSAVYDVGLEPFPPTGHSGFIFDFLNPLGGGGVSGAYVGGVALQAKAFSNSGNSKPNDVMIVGTNVASTTANVIFAATTCGLSAANPTGTGCLGTGGGGWNVPGGVVTSAGCSTALPTLAVCNMDVVTSTPFVDYKNNRVWVASHNNADTVDVNQPDVWELDANTGAVLAAVNLGITTLTNPTPGAPDIDSSPTGTQDQSLIFVGTNGGIVYAFDPTVTDTLNGTLGPVVPHQVGNPSANLGCAIQGFPVVASAASPWLIVVSTTCTPPATGTVTVLSFDGTNFNNPYAPNPNTISPTCIPSTPLVAPFLKNRSGQPIAIFSCGDGSLHQINLATGADEAQRVVDPAITVGDPSLDISTNEIIVGSTDGRVYSFQAPFI
jgi:hypothetical protein